MKFSLKGESSTPPLGVLVALVAPRTGDAPTPDSRGCGGSAAAVEPMPAGITGSHCHSRQAWSDVAVSSGATRVVALQLHCSSLLAVVRGGLQSSQAACA